MISERLSRNLQKENFNGAKSRYEEALRKCGYKLQHSTKTIKQPKQKSRKRNIMWFNPSFIPNVSTNV